MNVWKAVTLACVLNSMMFIAYQNWAAAIGFVFAAVFANIIAKECWNGNK